MHKAKLIGIRTPVLFEVDRKNSVIIMEYLKAKKIKEKINALKEKDFLEIGKQISLLHENSIVHGDLTTNNILIDKRKVFFIDFGLGFNSNKTEDFAVDLLGFKRTFLSSHPEKIKEWNTIQKGYKRKDKKNVLKRVLEVEKRGRYL